MVNILKQSLEGGKKIEGKPAVRIAILLLAFLLAATLACAKAPLTIEDVKAGKAEPAEYLEQLAGSLPEIREAKEAGLVEGVLYNPSTVVLEVLLAELLKDRKPAEELDCRISDSILSFEEQKREGATFGVLPSCLAMVGRNWPVFIIGFPSLLEKSFADDDLKNMLRHELQHAKDLSLGTRVADRQVTWKDFSKREIHPPFWKNLLELRATHLELYNILKSQVRGDARYGDVYVKSVALKYAEYYQGLQKAASTPFEKAAAEAQLKESQDIQLRLFEGGGLEINSVISGREVIITLIKKD